MTKVAWGKSTYGMMRYMERVYRKAITGSGWETYHYYQLNWLGDVVTIKKASRKGGWNVYVNDQYKIGYLYLDDCMDWVANVWGNEPVPTENLLNPKAGRLMIARKDRGGCTDPGTETYWSM